MALYFDMKNVLISIILICMINSINAEVTNPYETLGLSHRASMQEIKQAYKRLARKWHPDKNKNADAQNIFIDINKAYEILTDPERKELFDRFGKTEDTPNFRRSPDYSQFKRFEFDHFDNVFNQGGSGGYRFQFNFNQGSIYHKTTITLKAYENNVIPGSAKKPYLIIFYGDLCFPCLHVEPVWQKIIQELEPLGVGIASIHSQHESKLARKLGVNSLPYVVGIIDGQVIHYKDTQFSLSHIVDFCRKIFPFKTVIEVDEENVDDFLKDYSDNRVRVLLFSKSDTPKLRYLIVAYRFLSRAAFAHVHLNSESSRSIQRRYNVNPHMESLLIFNENTSIPIATLSMRELVPQTMVDVLEANKYLLLPRLSSQQLFDDLCPPDNGLPRKHLCVVLITQNTREHDPFRASMRDFIRDGDFSRDRIRFMFLYEEKQAEFVKALTNEEGAPANPVLHVVVLWRKGQDHVRYQWLDSPWPGEFSLDEKKSKQELEDNLNILVDTTEALPYDAKVSTLTDEYAHGILRRLVNRLVLMGDVLRQNITRQELLPAISVLLSVGFIILVGYLMSYLVQLEEQSIQEKYRKEGKTPPFPAANKPKPDCKLNIHELRGETYNGLVRLLKPGCRTIILLVDTDSKPKLLPKFYKSVHPYRKNKTLLFAFLMVEKNLEWYKRLLQQTLGEDRELNINPKNCIGTVLSLNGHRKYFCVYHAKHEEPGRGLGLRQNKAAGLNNVGGEFIGMQDTSDSENSDIEAGNLIKEDEQDVDSLGSILFEEHLLDGLPNWLDRLFEGSTKRYYIQYWPENMK